MKLSSRPLPSLLLLAALSLLVQAETNRRLSNMFQLILSRETFFPTTHGHAVPEPQQEELQVIGAGLPRTSTSSFVAALQKLGFKTYHMKEGVLDTPGDVSLWYHYYFSKKEASHDQIEHSSSNNVVTMGNILDRMAEHGFNASTDCPSSFWYLKQIQRYPNAKVVLTVRGDGNGQAWARSMTTTILAVLDVLMDIPYRWSPFVYMFEQLNAASFQYLDADTDTTTGYPVHEQLPAAYDAWVRHVQQNVPADNLLVHAPQDGWKPLCDFLSPLSPQVERNCEAIIASGEPYPHINERVLWQTALTILRCIAFATKLAPIVTVMLAVVLLVRRNKKAPQFSQEHKSR